ncbi:hypothetical protein ACPDHJ_05895 [Myroides sp. C8-3]|uniref:hypothetical protein n=1 Tax=Myroides sp. C8-3 TaxID=3400533 RepID=UPI003D2F7BB2
MKKIIALILFCILLYSCGEDTPDPCFISKEFIKHDLKYPEEAEFSIADCNKENLSSDTFVVLRKVIAKNAFGVKTAYIYKVTLKFNGGITSDKNNWELIEMRSEEYKQ